MDYGKFNSLPVWDRFLADRLQVLQPVSGALLLVTAAFVVYVALTQKASWQILFLAFLWSP